MTQTHDVRSPATPARERASRMGIVAVIAGTLIVFLIDAAPVWVRAVIAVAWFAVLVAVTAIVVRAVRARRGA